MSGYAITAAAAALAAGLFFQTQASACPHSIGTPTAALPSRLLPVQRDTGASSAGRTDVGPPRQSDRNPQPMSVRDVRLLVLAGLVLGLGGEGDKATLNERH